MGQKINDCIAEGNLIPPWLFHSDMDRLHQAKAQAKKIPEKYWFKDIWVRPILKCNRRENNIVLDRRTDMRSVGALRMHQP